MLQGLWGQRKEKDKHGGKIREFKELPDPSEMGVPQQPATPPSKVPFLPLSEAGSMTPSFLANSTQVFPFVKRIPYGNHGTSIAIWFYNGFYFLVPVSKVRFVIQLTKI